MVPWQGVVGISGAAYTSLYDITLLSMGAYVTFSYKLPLFCFNTGNPQVVLSCSTESAVFLNHIVQIAPSIGGSFSTNKGNFVNHTLIPL
jgi:hypothetical protein